MAYRWMLSQFYKDDNGVETPVCYAYGNSYACPAHPSTDDGWALVHVSTSPTQIEAARQDSRVEVMPVVFDPSPVSQRLIDAYGAKGISSGMSFAQALCVLGELDPAYINADA